MVDPEKTRGKGAHLTYLDVPGRKLEVIGSKVGSDWKLEVPGKWLVTTYTYTVGVFLGVKSPTDPITFY